MSSAVSPSRSSHVLKPWRTAAVLLTLLLLAGCAKPHVIPLADRPTREAMLARLDASRHAFTSLKGLGKYRFSQQGRSFSATQAIFAQNPDRLRVETLGLFGASAMMLSTDGEQMTVLVPGEAKAYQGAATPDLLQQFMRLPLRVEDVVSMLLQHPLLPAWDTDTIRHEPDGTSVLILNNAYGMRQEISFDLQLNLLRFDYYLAGGLQMRLSYQNFDDVTHFPKQLSLELPLDGIDMSFEFSDVDVNVSHADGRFVLAPPAGYEIIRINGGV